MPGRIHLLFLDRVEAFGRFQPFLADRDRVGLGQLQVFPEPQGEAGAVERQVGGVLGGDFLRRHLRLHRVRAGGDRVLGVRVEHGGAQLPRQQVVAQLAPVLRPRHFERVAGRADVGVLRFAVDPGGDVADEAVDRPLRVGDAGGDVFLHAAAGHVAHQPPREAARAALVERFFDRAVEVGVDLQGRAVELPAFAVVADLQRVAQRRQKFPLDGPLGFGFVHTPDVDAADRHPVGNRVVLRAVVGESGAHQNEQDESSRYQRDSALTSHHEILGTRVGRSTDMFRLRALEG